MKKITVFLLVLICFIQCSYVYAYDKDNVLIQENYQEESHFIDGYVFKDVNHSQTMDDDERVSYLKMNLWQENNLIDVVMTDEKGYFCFKDVKKGKKYQIVAECFSDCTLMKKQSNHSITNDFTIMQDYQVKTDEFIMNQSSLQFNLGFTPIAYHVEYDFNGGTGSFDWQQKVYREKATVIIPLNENLLKEGYHFLGWNTKKDGSGDMYQGNESFVMPSHDVKLYAIWEKDTIQKAAIYPTKQKADVVQTSDDYNITIILLFISSLWGLIVVRNLKKNR